MFVKLAVLPALVAAGAKPGSGNKPLVATNDDHPLAEDRGYALGPEEIFHDQMLSVGLKGLAHAMNLFHAMDNSGGMGFSLGGEKAMKISDIVKSLDFGSEPMHVIELGSHMGDGTLSFLDSIKDIPGSSVTSIDEDRHMHSIGKNIVGAAMKAENNPNIQYRPLQMPFSMGDLADSLRGDGVMRVHVVMMDHGDHSNFLDTIQELLGSDILAPGAKIISDNALTKKEAKKDYLKFVDNNKHFKTEVHEINFPYKDQIHVATYLGKHDEL